MALACEIVGTGIPLVLIHAFPLHSGMWKPQMQGLAHKAKIIVPDLPGFGKSPGHNQVTLPDMAREIASLLDSLGVRETAVLAGLSMGGYVALEFYRQFPERVKGLGLFSTKAGADAPEAREKRIKLADQIKREGLESFNKSILSQLVGKTTSESRPETIRQIKIMISLNSSQGVVAALRAMADRRDSAECLASIQCPTLIIAGEEDALIPFSESEAMHRQINGSQYCLLPKAGHLVNLEQPEAFQKAFEKYLL